MQDLRPDASLETDIVIGKNRLLIRYIIIEYIMIFKINIFFQDILDRASQGQHTRSANKSVKSSAYVSTLKMTSYDGLWWIQ